MTPVNRDAFRRTLSKALLSKEGQGHPFRGNQYTRGKIGHAKPETLNRRRAAAMRRSSDRIKAARASGQPYVAGVVGASRNIASLKRMAAGDGASSPYASKPDAQNPNHHYVTRNGRKVGIAVLHPKAKKWSAWYPAVGLKHRVSPKEGFSTKGQAVKAIAAKHESRRGN